MTKTPQIIVERLIQQSDALAADGRIIESIEMLEQALERCPSLADSWYNLGLRRRWAGRPEQALEAYQRALEYGAAGAEEIHLNRGVIFAEDLFRYADAEREYRAALQLAPEYIPALMNLANLREDEGKRNEARALYEHVLAVDYSNYEALARLVNCSEIEHPNDPLIERIRRALVTAGVTAAARASLGFSLGRALDAAGDYHGAWTAYASANLASKQSAPRDVAPYNRALHERLIDDVISICNESFLSEVSVGAPAEMPESRLLMICGMFRSGSTLVEHLLAGHPLVTSGGELDWLPSLIRQELAPFPTTLRRIDASRMAALARRYLDKRDRVFPQARVLTDKRPDNFLYLGVARAMFPMAKIVHTRRHPLDNCLSVWCLHLDHGMSYATDLLDIGHYYLQQERLMAHWRSVLGTSLHSVDYDVLVAEPRGELRKLLSHCGLDWNDRCLDPRNSSARVSTASVWQVRQPLYKSSSGRWRNYADQLSPLRAMLSSHGIQLAD